MVITLWLKRGLHTGEFCAPTGSFWNLLIQLKRSPSGWLAFRGVGCRARTWHLKKHPVHCRPNDHLASGALAWPEFASVRGVDRAGGGWWAGGVAGPVAFVGRESELSRLAGALGGDARMVLVVGDAGVGKTRFAGEGMARAAAAGMVTVRGECLPLAGMLPLLPVVQALRELGEPEGGRLLEEGLAAAPVYAREEVRRLLPWLGPGEGTGAGGPGEGWRRERLFSAVGELLDAVAARRAVCVVVEDVHWADSSTLDCLTFYHGRAACAR